ncbi:THAP domain-containing protein 3 isoform X3 [Rhinopithecus roxellana]|uniref:THAP domain-containing protein 3 isoform X3 n=1 Tax=Rhinopithecus roxellana TaxID=61622 RepID=UPI0012371640|nr:THAP domain-containing protein 3 isoform X3 [Rhinopithecus roxellana]
MPKSCAARQCCNRYSSRRKQLTFHRFPFSRPELLKEWVLNIGRANFQPKQHTVICSEHFRPECFSAFGNRKNLKHNAVPTVFAFQDPTQQVRENTDPASERGNASSSQKEKVLPEVGAGEDSPGRKMDTALEELQLPPNAEGPLKQVSPWRPQATEAVGRPAGPAGLRRPPSKQPSDHSYALLDLDSLKKKLFLTLKENEKLRKRLQAQRLVMQRMSSRLRACKGHRGLQARLGPEQQS